MQINVREIDIMMDIVGKEGLYDTNTCHQFYYAMSTLTSLQHNITLLALMHLVPNFSQLKTRGENSPFCTQVHYKCTKKVGRKT